MSKAAEVVSKERLTGSSAVGSARTPERMRDVERRTLKESIVLVVGEGMWDGWAEKKD